MKPKKQEEQVIEKNETAITIQEPNDLAKPQKDTKFAQASAKLLVDIIKKNNWSRKLGGQSEHIQYEGWQTVGKFYGYIPKTFDAEYVEYGGTWGFKAKAVVINEHTGIIVGGAEALCMSDEGNWRNKPKFQLASMAQTRAGSKALRQMLGFVVALAGYNPTPAEEMDGVHDKKPVTSSPLPTAKIAKEPAGITNMQKIDVMTLLGKKGKNMTDLGNAIKTAFNKTLLKDLTLQEADGLITRLKRLPDVKENDNGAVGHLESPDGIDMDQADKEIEQQRMEA